MAAARAKETDPVDLAVFCDELRTGVAVTVFCDEARTGVAVTDAWVVDPVPLPTVSADTVAAPVFAAGFSMFLGSSAPDTMFDGQSK